MGRVVDERNTVFALNEDEIDLMIEYLKRHSEQKYLFLFQVAINVGIRISDLLPLQVKHVRGKKKFKLIEQKTKKERVIHVSHSLGRLIDNYTDELNDDDYLFPSRQGNSHLKRVRVYSFFNDVGKKIGLEENIGTHTFRRTFASMVYKATKDIAKVQRYLNHSSPDVTIRYLGLREKEDEQFFEEFAIGI